MANEKAIKHDAKKPKLHLIPPNAILEVAKAYTWGADNYNDEYNYLRGGMKVSRLISSAERHINAFQRGEDINFESETHHLSNAACCLLMALEGLHHKVIEDDRFKNE